MADQEFRDKDIALMAISIEERGMAFYSRIAEKFSDEDIRNIFKRLAEEEREHQRTFQHIFEISTGENVFKKETAKYLRHLLASGVFPPKEKMEDLLFKIKTPRDALSVGIQAEKEAILFYHELYQNTVSTKVKDALSKLLEEEKMHLVEMRESMEELP